MKDKKMELLLFSIWDRTGLEAHLSQMAEKGWLIEKATNWGLHYRRSEPRKLTFSVCYYPKASAFDPGPTEDQETFYDFCQHSGWTLAAEYAQLQIFYNERENPVPIETDPMLEVETIHKAMKRNGLPAQLALALLAVVNGGLFVSSLLRDPIGQLSSAANLFTGFCWVMVIALAASEVISYYRWRTKAKKAAVRGEFYRTTSRVWLQKASLGILGVGLLYYFLSIFSSGNQVMMTIAPLTFLWMGLLFVLVRVIMNGLKRRKVSTNINRVVTIGAAFVLGYVMLGVILFGVLFGSSHGWFAGDNETYQYRGSTFIDYQDKLPLTVEDLLGGEYEGYTREWTDDASLLLARYTARQRPRFDAEEYREMPRLDYTIILVKLPALYDLCKNALLAEYDGTDECWENQAYVPIDPAPWGAAEAYQVMDAEYGPWDIYLLCYPDRFVVFRPDWEPTPEQMALVGERLGQT